MEEKPAPCPHKARVGQRLRGKWSLERLLGIGGTAAVYAAVHRNGLRGAVKILHSELKHNQESRGRFLYEGVVANRVKHEGIVSVLDDDVVEDGTPFLVMELLDGEAVDERMARTPGGRLGVPDTCRIIYRLLDVLAAAHEAGVVHRDVKPENVFITKGGCIKLLDFGIAHVDECPSKVVMTRFGYTMGTPAFMPPEQAIGDWANVGPATDLWAVGASMYNMLTATLVHGEEAMYKLLQRTATEPAPPIRSKLPELPEALASVVDKALAFDIQDRFQSARQMRAALEAAYPHCKTRLYPRASSRPPADEKKRRLLLTASATTTQRPLLQRRSTALVAGALGSAVFAAGLLAWGSSASRQAPEDVSAQGDGDPGALGSDADLEVLEDDAATMSPVSDLTVDLGGDQTTTGQATTELTEQTMLLTESPPESPQHAPRPKPRKPWPIERAFRTRL